MYELFVLDRNTHYHTNDYSQKNAIKKKISGTLKIITIKHLKMNQILALNPITVSKLLLLNRISNIKLEYLKPFNFVYYYFY